MGYTGNIAPVPAGQGGLSGDKNQHAIDIARLIFAELLTYEDGTWRKEGGAEKVDANGISASPELRAINDWHPSGATQRLVSYGNDGVLYKEGGGDLDDVQLKTGLSTAAKHGFFLECGAELLGLDRTLFFFTGENIVQVLAADGATTTDIGNEPTDWTGTDQPIGGVVHRNAVWSYGNLNNPHRLYKSLETDHEEFISPTVFTMSVFPGVGRRIVAAQSFGGLLFLFKWPNGIFWVDDSDTDSGNWFVKQLIKEVGVCQSPYAALGIDNDVMFLSEEGNFHLLSAVEHFKNVHDSDLSAALKLTPWLRENVNLSRLDQVQSVWYGHKKQALWTLPPSGETKNRLIIKFDFMDPNNPKVAHNFRDTAVSLGMRQDVSDGIHRPMFGDDSGNVYMMDRAARTKDSAGYDGKFQIPHTDFGYLDERLAVMRKNYDFLEMIVEPMGTWNVSVDVILDGTFLETINFSMGGGAALGAFVLGTDRLAGDLVTNVKKRLTGSARRLSLVGVNSGDSQDFSIARMMVHFRTSDERIDS